MKNKIRIILIGLIFSTALIATELSQDQLKEKENFKNTLTVKTISEFGTIKEMKKNLYIKNTEFYDILRDSIDNEDLKEAIYVYYYKKQRKKINKRIVVLPNYNDFFEEIKKATDNDNLLASYFGLSILEDQFLINSGNLIAKKYLRDISRPLAKAGYPIGLFWYGKSYLKEWSFTGKGNYNKATRSYERAIENIDKKIAENTLTIKERKNLERFRLIVLLAKGKSSGLSILDEKERNGERTKIKRKFDLSKYKKGHK